ncbi:MAG: thioredoxin family protein [Pseudomonadota bacterium]|jgi:DsbC/DsbD-like thiol-disulfide interchange protein/cytochrome c biogenesis protein CcdA|nr:thioredoxin family protein [Pseudomonadota bacterium]
MLRRLLFLLALIGFAWPAAAQPRVNAIQPELVAEGPARPGGEVELTIVMHTRDGWHGYWQNPGDAGLPMEVQWQLPPGFEVGPLRYPVPSRLEIAGLMNYVYERDYAILVRLKVPPGVTGSVPIRAQARWLACTDEVCVPEQGAFSLSLPTGGVATMDPRFNAWRRALPRPLLSAGRFAVDGDRFRVAIPFPRSASITEPYLFPITDRVVDYQAPQSFRRSGDLIIAELKKTGGAPPAFAGVLALGDGSGLEFTAAPGAVPAGSSPVAQLGSNALLLAVLGAIVGGILLNLMPCVFPILAIKALHLARSGGDEREARRDALGYAAGAILGTGALGVALLAIRAGGSAAGWAFQLQDPRTIMLLMLLSVAITINLVGLFTVPAVTGSTRPAGSFGTGALAAFVATPCAGPFLGAALGTALLLPLGGSVLVFAALGLGLALPFVAVAFVPALRKRLPAPGPWMQRLQHFLAIPMGATAVAALWLLYRRGGSEALVTGLIAAALVAALLIGFGFAQRSGRRAGAAVAALTLLVGAGAVLRSPEPSAAAAQLPAGADRWSHDAVAAALDSGHPAFVYFTADWCLSCKVNEAAAIDREAVQAAFKQAGVETFVGDWTDGDPAITRFLESRGRAGVPLYLWYEPGKPPEALPQLLTPSILTSRALRAR